MRGHCSQLHWKLQDAKFPIIEFEEIEGAPHEYIVEKENEILSFFSKCVL